MLDSGFFGFRRIFDARLGGFGDAPKFPRPSIHHFLLRYHARTHNREALDMVLLTLREMAKGGIHDQLGGGFHRYSVDDRWFVPHFEKMLYDQAQLATSYLEAFQITGDPLYAETARRILDYVLRDMTAPEGGFYSAEDADSAIDPAQPEVKGEGAFYIWTAAEIRALLAARRPPIGSLTATASRRAATWPSDPHGEFAGRNILYQARTIEETARQFGRPAEEVRAALAAGEARAARSRARPRPPASRRQDSDRLEWADDLRASRWAAPCSMSRATQQPRAARRISRSAACTTRQPACCCAAIARAKRPSPAFSTITPCSRRGCWICTKPSSIDATWIWRRAPHREADELFEDLRWRRFFSSAADDAAW